MDFNNLLDIFHVRRITFSEILDTLIHLDREVRKLEIDFYKERDIIKLAKETLKNPRLSWILEDVGASVESRSGLDLQDIPNTSKLRVKLLNKKVKHVNLVENFVKKIVKDTSVTSKYIEEWQDKISKMNELANGIENTDLQAHVKNYIETYKVFMAMYLIFKHSKVGVE